MIRTSEIHKNDIGTVLQVTILDSGSPLDLSSCTVMTLRFRKPNGEVFARAAEFVTDGTDGKLEYTTAAGDLDQSGAWRLQVHLLSPAGEWNSDAQAFTVADVLQANASESLSIAKISLASILEDQA
jgi:hypothetical protein